MKCKPEKLIYSSNLDMTSHDSSSEEEYLSEGEEGEDYCDILGAIEDYCSLMEPDIACVVPPMGSQSSSLCRFLSERGTPGTWRIQIVSDHLYMTHNTDTDFTFYLGYREGENFNALASSNVSHGDGSLFIYNQFQVMWHLSEIFAENKLLYTSLPEPKVFSLRNGDHACWYRRSPCTYTIDTRPLDPACDRYIEEFLANDAEEGYEVPNSAPYNVDDELTLRKIPYRSMCRYVEGGKRGLILYKI